jgi:hypothetical protein
MGAGFGVYADRTAEEDGQPSDRSAVGLGLAILAFLGAAVAVLFWVL